MTAPSASPLQQTIDVETPELVVVSYTVAGLGSRSYAALFDYTLCLLAMVLAAVLGALLGGAGIIGGERSTAVAIALLIFWQFFILWGYYVLFEALNDGQTPGKKRQGLRVVRDGGYSVTFGASAIRNLVRLVDMQPLFTYFVGMTSMLTTRDGKRLGDIVAGTMVVREALLVQPPELAAAAGSETSDASGAPVPLETVLTDEQFTVLGRFLERRSELAPERRSALAGQLAQRFEHVLESADRGSPMARLLRLHASEERARRAGATSLGTTGARREQNAIVASRSPRWIAFAALLGEAQRGGLAALGEERVRTFVAEYRDLAADLARLRTASGGGTSDEVLYLGRLVSGAHNLLYRRRAFSGLEVARELFVRAPREVRRSWRPVTMAAVLLFLPSFIAYSAVARHPEVASVFIPAGMLDRAEDGVRRAASGEGYITDPQLFRPVLASAIISNNVQVSFAAFAMGITAGLGTAFILVTNGVSLGGVFGLYASKQIGSLLLAFVAPHGVLELTAICIAGGAGLLLGAALLMPGARSRRRALVEDGVRAIRLIGAATLLLLVAGVIEGFISPIEWWPLEGKLAVSGVTAVFLVLYLRAGLEREVEPSPDPAAAEPHNLLALGEADHTAPRALSSR